MKEQNSQDASGNTLHLELPALPEQVGRARRAVAEYLGQQAWEADDTDALLLAVGEACNNAVNYGGRGCADPKLVVFCQPLDGRCLQVEVRNQGNGFYPDLKECGEMPATEFATHGRGFGLMLALVDQVQVLSDGENTIVRLTKSPTA